LLGVPRGTKKGDFVTPIFHKKINIIQMKNQNVNATNGTEKNTKESVSSKDLVIVAKDQQKTEQKQEPDQTAQKLAEMEKMIAALVKEKQEQAKQIETLSKAQTERKSLSEIQKMIATKAELEKKEQSFNSSLILIQKALQQVTQEDPHEESQVFKLSIDKLNFQSREAEPILVISKNIIIKELLTELSFKIENQVQELNFKIQDLENLKF